MSASPPATRRRSRRTDPAADGAVIRVTVDGKNFTVREADLTAKDAGELRRATGLSFAGLLKAATSDPDIDIIAGIIWLARRTNGERTLDYDQVAENLGYDADITVPDDRTGDKGKNAPAVIDSETVDSPEA
jgi:hypothetical protein